MKSKRALTRPFFHSFPRTASIISSSLSNKPSNSSNHYLTLLSSCKDLCSVLQIHARLIVSGYKPNNFTSTHLVNSYFTFQKCDFARSVFDSTPNPSVIVWNSMIRGYARSNQHQRALDMYNCMMEQSLEPDRYTFTFAVKACAGISNLLEGFWIHQEIVDRGLETDAYIGTGLVDMYCKLGDLESAREVFERMPNKDIAAWNAMIAGLSLSSEYFREAFDYFRAMQVYGGVEPNSVSLLNVFPAVCKLLDMKSCKCIHAYVFRRRLTVAVTNGLIDLYCKCGDAYAARKLFDRMQERDHISWGTVMAGYAHNGLYSEVLELFDNMKTLNMKINEVSAVSALLAAAETRDLVKGLEIHEWTIKQRIDSNILVATPLITMYAKCGELVKAKKMFGGLQERDLVCWSAIIAAFAQAGYSKEALLLFRDMLHSSVKPSRVTLLSVLSACGELSSGKLGECLHCYAIKVNIHSDNSVGTALVSMYAKCTLFNAAFTIFNEISHQDVVTWNSLINGYAQIGDSYLALEMFQKLLFSGVQPDSGTMAGVLPACALLRDLYLGSCIHGLILKDGFESDSQVTNALVDMYAKCGILRSAESLFNKSEFIKDEVSWNTMIAGYMQNGCANEAISAFHHMKLHAFQPNLVTIVSILPAAAHLAAIKVGMAIHGYIKQMGFQSSILVGNSLIDMYAKCGRLDYAEKIFNEMENKDTVSWNAMLAGYGANGFGDCAIAFFSLMQESFIEVDSVSFLNILSACRHAGLIEEGRKIFRSMHKHNLEPGVAHYACMVDLLGRGGLFDEVLVLIETMPMQPDAAVWGALLGACKMHSNIELAELALKHLVKLEPENPAHYVVLSNVFSQLNRWHDAGNTRLKMNGLKKNPGCSWVDEKKTVHAF